MRHRRTQTNQSGVTLMEMVVYLGISFVIVAALSGALVQVVRSRTDTANQYVAQHNARVAMERITYATRNAYSLVVAGGGNGLYTQSRVVDDSGAAVIRYSLFLYDAGGETLLYGVRDGGMPALETLAPITDPGVRIPRVQFEQFGSALEVSLEVERGTRGVPLTSTISLRQI